MTLAEFTNLVRFTVKESDIKNVNNSINTIKNTAQKALGAIGITLSIAGITKGIQDCVDLASEVQEMQNKFDVVFKGMNDTVEDWAKNFADRIGRNSNDIKTYLADIQNLVVGFMGTDMREEAYELTRSMTELALDLASFNNTDEQVAVNAMQKAVMGESEAAKTIGAVLNDMTRAEAMATLGLKGKYDALDQATKMMVNYQAILNQSPDAIGDCERSLGSYRSTLIAFQSKLKEIKTLIGQFFMPTAQKIVQIGTRGLTLVRDWIQRLHDFAEAAGGAERIIGVLAGTLGGLFLVMNIGPIVTGFARLLALLNPVTVLLVGVAAAFGVVALVVEDFISFMQGKNSLFGDALKEAGIDLGLFRMKVFLVINRVKQAFREVKNFAGGIGETLRNAFSKLMPALVDFIVDKGPALAAGFKTAIDLVKEFAENRLKRTQDFIKRLLPVIGDLAKIIGGALSDAFDQVSPLLEDLADKGFSKLLDLVGQVNDVIWDLVFSILPELVGFGADLLPILIEFAQSALPPILELLGSLLPLLLEFAQDVIPLIAEVLEQIIPFALQIAEEILPIVAELLEQLLPLVLQIAEDILPVVLGLVSDLLPVLNPIITLVSSLAESILPVIVDLLGMLSPILEPILGLLKPIAEVISWIVDGLGSLVGYASQGIGNLLSGLFSGGLNIGAADQLVGTGPNVGIPGHATGSDYTEDAFIAGENGPELITGQRGKKVFTALQTGAIFRNIGSVLGGIGAIKDQVGGSIQNFLGTIGRLAEFSAVSPRTSSAVSNNSISRSIVQNVNISNQYNGDRAIQKQAAAGASKTAKDATAEMARALAYTR